MLLLPSRWAGSGDSGQSYRENSLDTAEEMLFLRLLAACWCLKIDAGALVLVSTYRAKTGNLDKG